MCLLLFYHINSSYFIPVNIRTKVFKPLSTQLAFHPVKCIQLIRLYVSCGCMYLYGYVFLRVKMIVYEDGKSMFLKKTAFVELFPQQHCKMVSLSH